MLSCRPAHCAPVLLALFALGACAEREVPIVETQGECGDMFSARICTWARMQGDSVIDIGAMVPVALAMPPSSSVTLSVTVKTPASAYACVASRLVAVPVLSPKSHW